VGGGSIRDTLIRQIPSVLRSDLYAIPALIAAALTAGAVRAGICALPAALGTAAVCFVVRMPGWRFHVHAPGPPSAEPPEDG
jgi:uncharacterized membrane protein YeiH